MPKYVEIAEELYKKLKPYENPEVPLFTHSTHLSGGYVSLQRILDLLDDLPKISEAKLGVERPDYSQFRNLKGRDSGTFKVKSAEYLFQWGIEFKFNISVPHNLYEALINYVDEHGFVNGRV